MISECPGSQKFKKPQPEFIKCVFCNQEVELWTDEVEAVCPNCKRSVSRKTEQGCLDWCKHAEECLGEKRFKHYRRNKERKNA